jgi:hypothetical protein
VAVLSRIKPVELYNVFGIPSEFSISLAVLGFKFIG